MMTGSRLTDVAVFVILFGIFMVIFSLWGGSAGARGATAGIRLGLPAIVFGLLLMVMEVYRTRRRYPGRVHKQVGVTPCCLSENWESLHGGRVVRCNECGQEMFPQKLVLWSEIEKKQAQEQEEEGQNRGTEE